MNNQTNNSNYQQNSNYQEINNKQNFYQFYDNRRLKLIIKLSIVLAIFIHTFIFGSFVSLFILKQNSSLWPVFGQFTNSNIMLSSGFFLLIIIVSFSMAKSIIFGYKLWTLANSPNIEEKLMNDKWSFILLGLSIGGLLIPIVIRRMIPNVETTGTISSKKFMAKNFGLAWFCGSILSIILLLFFTTLGNITTLNSNSIIMLISTISILFAIFAFSFSALKIFSKENIQNEINQRTNLGKIANIFSWIILIVVSIELIIQIITSILHIIQAVSNIMNSLKNFGFFSLINVFIEMFIISIIIYTIQIIMETIRALWSAQRNNDNLVTFRRINGYHARRYEERLQKKYYKR